MHQHIRNALSHRASGTMPGTLMWQDLCLLSFQSLVISLFARVCFNAFETDGFKCPTIGPGSFDINFAILQHFKETNCKDGSTGK